MAYSSVLDKTLHRFSNIITVGYNTKAGIRWQYNEKNRMVGNYPGNNGMQEEKKRTDGWDEIVDTIELAETEIDMTE